MDQSPADQLPEPGMETATVSEHPPKYLGDMKVAGHPVRQRIRHGVRIGWITGSGAVVHQARG